MVSEKHVHRPDYRAMRKSDEMRRQVLQADDGKLPLKGSLDST